MKCQPFQQLDIALRFSWEIINMVLIQYPMLYHRKVHVKFTAHFKHTPTLAHIHRLKKLTR